MYNGSHDTYTCIIDHMIHVHAILVYSVKKPGVYTHVCMYIHIDNSFIALVCK